jgi:hypothetical protein
MKRIFDALAKSLERDTEGWAIFIIFLLIFCCCTFGSVIDGAIKIIEAVKK